MKKWVLFLFSATSLVFSALPASARVSPGDIIGGIIDGINNGNGRDFRSDRGGDYRGRPGRGRPWDPGRDRPGYGDYSCRAYDTGHEEHFSGHDSCRSCLREHGDCVERCESTVFICRAEGRDRHGHYYPVRDPGYGSSDREASHEAMRNCRFREGLEDCRVVSCDRGRGDVTTRRCGDHRGGGRW